MASSFTQAWLEDAEGARALLPLDPWCAEDRLRAVEQAASRSCGAQTLAALRAMNERLGPSAAREENLAALAAGGCAAVLSGQQAGLFLGPLYTLYKAAHAIVLARRLAEESGRPVVPVFWVASEDHDLPEISWCAAPGDEAEPVRMELVPPDDAPIPVASRLLGEEVVARLADLDVALTGHPHAEETLALFGRHYRPHASFPAAFAGVLGELFADEGLLILDSREPELLRAAAPVHRRAFEDADRLAEGLLGRVRELQEAGYGAPVHVRAGAPLPFVHPDGPDGPRYRVLPAGDGWELLGADRTVDRETVRRWLEDEPERFSASALLRPLVQDCVLPTAAYVGGPGEIAYLAQTAPLYEALDRPMPLLAPRARFRVIGPRERRLCKQLNISPDEAALGEDELLARLGEAARDEDQLAPETLHESLTAPLQEQLTRFHAQACSVDPALAKAVARTRDHLKDQLTRLVDRYRRTLTRNDEVTRGRLARLRGALYPDGVPQERIFGLASFTAREGVAAFKARVLAAIDPLPTTSKDLLP